MFEVENICKDLLIVYVRRYPVNWRIVCLTEKDIVIFLEFEYGVYMY